MYYQAEKLTVGTSPDFSKCLSIGRVAPADQIKFPTERYPVFSNFDYNIPIKENGDYVLILKFIFKAKGKQGKQIRPRVWI